MLVFEPIRSSCGGVIVFFEVATMFGQVHARSLSSSPRLRRHLVGVDLKEDLDEGPSDLRKERWERERGRDTLWGKKDEI